MRERGEQALYFHEGGVVNAGREEAMLGQRREHGGILQPAPGLRGLLMAAAAFV